MDLLLKEGSQLGLGPAEVTSALRLGRALTESNWCSSLDGKGRSLQIASELFERGRYVEYQCYDDGWREQGKAVVILESWEDQSAGLFTGRHALASDDYYAWYMENQVKDDVVYHLCEGSSRACRKKLVRGDRRVLIHIDRWRMLSPQVMLETDYLKPLGRRLGEQVIADAAKEKAQLAVPPAGTGLDAAMQAAGQPGGAPPGSPPERGEKKKARARSRSPKPRKGLAARLAAQERSKLDEKHEDKRKVKGKKKKKQKKKDGRSSSGSTSSGNSSESSGSLFREASARGGDLWKLSQKKPGLLTEAALREMSRYLAGQSEVGLEKESWGQQKVLAYLNQIVLSAHPPSKIGVRAHRELVTVATCIDHLLSSKNLECLDVLIQRFKAIELSIQDGSWHLARHFELIPPSGAQLSREEERQMATKAEARRLKIAEAGAKAMKHK